VAICTTSSSVKSITCLVGGVTTLLDDVIKVGTLEDNERPGDSLVAGGLTYGFLTNPDPADFLVDEEYGFLGILLGLCVLVLLLVATVLDLLVLSTICVHMVDNEAGTLAEAIAAVIVFGGTSLSEEQYLALTLLIVII
jgi:hypothetical protein